MTGVQDPVSSLNHLIITCKDGEQALRNASEKVHRRDLEDLFSEYSQQLQAFSNELQQHVAQIGGEPQQNGSVAGSLHRGWVTLKTAVAGDDDVVLAEAERTADEIIRSYQEALAEELAADTRILVEKQYRALLQARDVIHSLRPTMPENTERLDV